MERTNRTKQLRWIMVIGGIALIAYLGYASFQQTQKKYDVCMEFKGATHCATATGSTPEEAIRSAQEIDCELVTNGRDELTVCLGMQPTSAKESK
jgi:hypothetical protein